jgi:hypothetical protein
MIEIYTQAIAMVELSKKMKALSKRINDVEFDTYVTTLLEDINNIKMSALDTKEKMLNLREENLNLREKIKEFEEYQLKVKSTVSFMSGRYKVDENGVPYGDPYCKVCFEKDSRLMPIVRSGRSQITCKCCETTMLSRDVPADVGNYIISLGPGFELRVFE